MYVQPLKQLRVGCLEENHATWLCVQLSCLVLGLTTRSRSLTLKPRELVTQLTVGPRLVPRLRTGTLRLLASRLGLALTVKACLGPTASLASVTRLKTRRTPIRHQVRRSAILSPPRDG